MSVLNLQALNPIKYPLDYESTDGGSVLGGTQPHLDAHRSQANAINGACRVQQVREVSLGSSLRAKLSVDETTIIEHSLGARPGLNTSCVLMNKTDTV